MKILNGADTRNSCMAAEKKKTTKAAVVFENPQFIIGKNTCRTSQLCTGRFQYRQYLTTKWSKDE